MTAYIIRRLLLLIPTLIGITMLTYFIIRISPGDPTELMTSGMMNEEAAQETADELKRRYGLDKPIYIGYFQWIGGVVQLDFGTSFIDRKSVLSKIGSRLPATIYLNIISIIIAYAVAFPVGVYAAVWRNSLFDKVSGLIFYMGFSIPSFWLALLLQRYLSVQLNLLPLYGTESINHDTMGFLAQRIDHGMHAVMPVICLTIGSFAFFARFIRSTLLEVLQMDYVRSARAKGLAEWKVIYKHALRNVLIPVITILATIIPRLLSGAVILELIFSWPGIGLLFFQSILTRDYPVIMAMTMFTAVLTLIALFLADILYAVADPRVSLE